MEKLMITKRRGTTRTTFVAFGDPFPGLKCLDASNAPTNFNLHASHHNVRMTSQVFAEFWMLAVSL